MPPEQRRYLLYLRSLGSQVAFIERVRDQLHTGSNLTVPQYRILLFMLAYLEGQIACIVRNVEIPEED